MEEKAEVVPEDRRRGGRGGGADASSSSSSSACCICLEEQDVAGVNSIRCPSGHVICTRDLGGLALFNIEPFRLRRYRGYIPCPGYDPDGQTCGNQWSYREIHRLLPEAAQIGYIEGVLGVLGALMEGKFGSASDSANARHHHHHHLDAAAGGKSMPADYQEPKRGQKGAEAADSIQHVLTSILNLRCPQCHTAFIDFDACASVACMACGTLFCALCLAEAPAEGGADEAHGHVVAVHGDLFFNESETKRQQNHYRAERLVDYLVKLAEEEADESLAWRVLEGVSAELQDLGLDLQAIEGEVKKRREARQAAQELHGPRPLIVVENAKSFVRRREGNWLAVSDVIGLLGDFVPGGVVLVVDTMGVALAEGLAALYSEELAAAGDFFVANPSATSMTRGGNRLTVNDPAVLDVNHLPPTTGLLRHRLGGGAAMIGSPAAFPRNGRTNRRVSPPRHLSPLPGQPTHRVGLRSPLLHRRSGPTPAASLTSIVSTSSPVTTAANATLAASFGTAAATSAAAHGDAIITSTEGGNINLLLPLPPPPPAAAAAAGIGLGVLREEGEGVFSLRPPLLFGNINNSSFNPTVIASGPGPRRPSKLRFELSSSPGSNSHPSSSIATPLGSSCGGGGGTGLIGAAAGGRSNRNQRFPREVSPIGPRWLVGGQAAGAAAAAAGGGGSSSSATAAAIGSAAAVMTPTTIPTPSTTAALERRAFAFRQNSISSPNFSTPSTSAFSSASSFLFSPNRNLVMSFDEEEGEGGEGMEGRQSGLTTPETGK